MWLKYKFTCGHILLAVRKSSLKLTETKLFLNLGLHSLVSHEGIDLFDHADDSETFRCDVVAQVKALDCVGSTDEEEGVDLAEALSGESAVHDGGGSWWEALEELAAHRSADAFDESCCLHFLAELGEFLEKIWRA
jgi:hypothetical protein